MQATPAIEKPDFPALYSVANVLKLEKSVTQKCCEKALQLAQKYLESGDPISSFNRNFMNEMVKADPEKIKICLMQERGMSIGVDTQKKYNLACKYYAQSNEDNYRERLADIEKVTKKVMDTVFSGKCTLVEVEKAREFMKNQGWVTEEQTCFVDRAK